MPSTIEITVANNPTNSEIREPQISRVSIERPFSSVPSQYSRRRRLEDAAGCLGDLEPFGVGQQWREHGDQDEEHQHDEADHARSGWLRNSLPVARSAGGVAVV